MKNFKISLFILLVLTLALSSCSKKGADKIIGKWKMDRIEQMEKQGIIIDVTYEFTKDTMIIQGSFLHKIQGMDSVIKQPEIRADYTVKSDDGTNVVIEAIHPTTKEKAELKIKFEGDKMIIPNPDGSVSNFSKI